jgi:hypothetical protein
LLNWVRLHVLWLNSSTLLLWSKLVEARLSLLKHKTPIYKSSSLKRVPESACPAVGAVDEWLADFRQSVQVLDDSERDCQLDSVVDELHLFVDEEHRDEQTDLAVEPCSLALRLSSID